MKVAIDSSMCVGHAQCSAICPSVFGNDEFGYAVLIGDGTVPEEDRARRGRCCGVLPGAGDLGRRAVALWQVCAP